MAAGTFLAVTGLESVGAQPVPGQPLPPAPAQAPAQVNDAKTPDNPSGVVGLWRRIRGGVKPASYEAPVEPAPLAAPQVPVLPPTAPEPHHAAAAIPPETPGEGCPARPSSYWGRFGHGIKENFIGFAAEFEPAGFGESLYQTMRTQVANGETSHMVLYHYDFVCGSSALNLRGKDKLHQITALLPHTFCPVVIERTPDNPQLAEVRRLMVLQELAAGQFPIPPERVVIGPPLANGLRGVEAVIVHDNMLRQTQAQGIQAGLGGGSIGGTGGQGFGATGRAAAGPGPVGP